jgi:short-subunit dehydrogenase
LGKTLVAITGASSGIGAAFARRLAAEHDLLLIARRQDRLERLQREFAAAYGTQVETMQADLSKDEDLGVVAKRIETDSRLSLLINNAGFGTKGRFWEAKLETQEEMHRLHIMATLRLSHAALRNMVPRDFGGIINVASVAAFVRASGSIGYSATKSWMTSFTEGLHLELRSVRSNVVVQALCPGFTYSEFHDALGVSREQMMRSSAFWMTADAVVDASLQGLAKRKLFVVPGWRYQLLTGIITKLPYRARIAVEGLSGQFRQQRISAAGNTPKQVGGQ